MRCPVPGLANAAVAAVAGLLGAGVFVVPAWAAEIPTTGDAAGASAATKIDPDAPTALLTGTLRVLADVDHTRAGSLEAARRAAAVSLAGSLGPASGPARSLDPVSSYLQVGGVWVPLRSAAVGDVAPGSAVTVRVEVPEPVVQAVEDGERVDATPDSRSAATTTIPEGTLDAAADAPAPASSALARASAVSAATTAEPVAAQVVTATAPAAAVVTSSQSVTVVAVSMLGGSDSYYADSTVDSLLASVSDYWGEQTGGAVGFRRDGAVTRYASSLSCSDPNALWSEAAQRSGFIQGAGRHLLLLLPPQAYAAGCSYGLGSVGASPGAGGVTYVSDASWPAIAHELGHNMSLLHADRLQCGSAVDEAVGRTGGYRSCTVLDYGDRTDVMSSAAARSDGTPIQATGSASAFALARLGLLASGGRTTVTGAGTSTWTIQPLSSLSGLRSVVVTDPRSDDVYDLEVRANSGRDTFGWGGSTRVTYGLRVLKANDDGGSLLLDPTPTSGTDTNVVVAPGTTFTSAAGGVAVRTTNNPDGSVTAQVSVAPAGKDHWAPSAVATTVAGRLQGDDRYGTATAVSGALVKTPTSGQRVFVASGSTFPDALAAGAAAGLASSPTPVVLVPASGALPASVTAELRRVAPSRITVVGGSKAVDDGVVDQLRAFSGTVERVQGDDRYATSATVARNAAADAGGSTGPVFLATGLDFPDALSGAAAAAQMGGSLLLTDPQNLSAPAQSALAAMQPSRVYVLGGQVSAGVLSQVSAAVPGAAVQRLAGDDRYGTAVEVSKVSHAQGAGTVVLATGADFPDALAGGPLAASLRAPLLLVQPSCAPGAVVDQVAGLKATTTTALGGTRSLSDAAASLTRC
ncbi:Putative cell wall binding repeat 2 [Quadrisphaera granulorum]|uniref:Putative cell wall binding repeat protein n=1 Tax=Quadrisphaera granulorum TaxID=317664 RepID=A0A316A676_9ACTN|nr:cell wall-binding repeat-containing protein [Quadrisphaera granulorum]PWJ53019.1 putative cell wall binding repeat protein [Quadrisphaera granulorum]SZE97184.1 Putative cell wall binding repeat 2 [Quadrisphaera granulorum]